MLSSCSVEPAGSPVRSMTKADWKLDPCPAVLLPVITTGVEDAVVEVEDSVIVRTSSNVPDGRLATHSEAIDVCVDRLPSGLAVPIELTRSLDAWLFESADRAPEFCNVTCPGNVAVTRLELPVFSTRLATPAEPVDGLEIVSTTLL